MIGVSRNTRRCQDEIKKIPNVSYVSDFLMNTRMCIRLPLCSSNGVCNSVEM
jgi:hypothetical protein